jgi:hypothetical protein
VGSMAPKKFQNLEKKNKNLRVNNIMVPTKMKFNLHKKFTILIKARLRNRMKDEFLVDHLQVYIEK